jgi:hypothetical protein
MEPILDQERQPIAEKWRRAEVAPCPLPMLKAEERDNANHEVFHHARNVNVHLDLCPKDLGGFHERIPKRTVRSGPAQTVVTSGKEVVRAPNTISPKLQATV